MKNSLLKIDAIVNFILGVLLLLIIPFPEQMTEFFGVPKVDQAFYPSVMGGVFIGIGISLFIESNRKNTEQPAGLGLAGAIAINLCGGGVLIGWLSFGNLNLPIRGTIFLWSIAILLVAISGVEIIAQRRKLKSNFRDVQG